MYQLSLKARAHRMFIRISIRSMNNRRRVHTLWSILKPEFEFTWTKLETRSNLVYQDILCRKVKRKRNCILQQTS